MNWEKIKSWLLTALVLLSIIFFWNLVVFQENYEAIPKQEYIHEVSIAEKRKLGELIIPDKMVYRISGDYFVGTEIIEVVKNVFTNLASWNFYNFQSAIDDFRKELNNKNQSMLLLQFPDDVPYDLIKSMFTIDAKDVPYGIFDYIVVFPAQMMSDEGIVYFVNEEMTTAYQARVRLTNINSFQNALHQFINEIAVPYIVYEKPSGALLFVMENGPMLRDYQYLPKKYSVTGFVDALFQDPSLVTRRGNQYTDTSSLMNVYEDIGMFRFVDPTVTKAQVTISGLIQKSTDFINEHSGWTDQFYYSSTDILNSRVVYRLYLSDYPVFNSSGYSEIKIVLGNDGIYSYERPYFSLNFSTTESEEYVLSSGNRVLDYLESMERFDMNTVSDIRIGYQFTRAYNDMLIKLEPSWFYRIDNSWVRLPESELGGAKDGLE